MQATATHPLESLLEVLVDEERDVLRRLAVLVDEGGEGLLEATGQRRAERHETRPTHIVDGLLESQVAGEGLAENGVEFVLEIKDVLHPSERRLGLGVTRRFGLLLAGHVGLHVDVVAVRPRFALALAFRVGRRCLSLVSPLHHNDQPLVHLASNLDDPLADSGLQRRVSVLDSAEQRVEQSQVVQARVLDEGRQT